MTKRRTIACAALALFGVIAGCSSSSTGNSTNVTGSWLAQFTTLTGTVAGHDVSCQSSQPTTLTLNQSGTTITGTFSGGELQCTANGVQENVPIGSGDIVNGTLSGNTVTFHFASPATDFTGSVNGNSASGNVTIDDNTQQINVTGTWSATKS